MLRSLLTKLRNELLSDSEKEEWASFGWLSLDILFEFSLFIWGQFERFEEDFKSIGLDGLVCDFVIRQEHVFDVLNIDRAGKLLLTWHDIELGLHLQRAFIGHLLSLLNLLLESLGCALLRLFIRRLHHLNLLNVTIGNLDLIVNGVFESLVTLEECDERHVEHIMHQVFHLIGHSVAFLGLNRVEVLLGWADDSYCSLEAWVFD